MMPSTKRLIIAFVTLGLISVPLTYYVNKLRNYHKWLSTEITHDWYICDVGMMKKWSQELNSLPQEIVQNEDQYVVLYDVASKPVSTSELPTWPIRDLLTAYLRNLLVQFANSSQARVLRMIADSSLKQSIDPKRVSALRFEAGDKIFSGYKVLYRQDDRIEIKMDLGGSETAKHIEGRLILSVDVDQDNDLTYFKTQSVIWTRKDSGTRIPIEGGLPRYFHELASWALIDQGTRHLIESGK